MRAKNPMTAKDPAALYASIGLCYETGLPITSCTCAQHRTDSRTVLLAYVSPGPRGYCIEITRNGTKRYYTNQTNYRAALVRNLTKPMLYTGGLRVAK